MPAQQANAQITIDVDANSAISKISGVTSSMDKMKNKINEVNHEGARALEEQRRGIDKAVEKLGDAFGLSGISARGTGILLAVTAGSAIIASVYENYKKTLEKMKQDQEEAIKETVKSTNAQGGSTGITLNMAQNIMEKNATISSADISKYGAPLAAAIHKARHAVPMTATEEQNKITEGILALKEASPTAAGAPELTGVLQANGINVDGGMIAKLIEASHNRPEELAKLLTSHLPSIKRRKLNAEGYAYSAAYAVGNLSENKVHKRLSQLTPEDLRTAAALNVGPALIGPDQQVTHAQEDYETMQEKIKAAAINPDTNRNLRMVMEMHRLMPNAFNNGKDIDDFMKSTSFFNKSGVIRPVSSLPSEDFEKEMIHQMKLRNVMATGFSSVFGNETSLYDLPVSQSAAAEELAKKFQEALDRSMNKNTHDNVKNSQTFSRDLPQK